MSDAVVVEEQRINARIHLDQRADVLIQSLRLVASDSGPPLAIERTVPAAGPTRAPVILVHGLAQNRYSWRIEGRSLCARLAAAGYEVLNLELRGHGLSREYGARNATSFSQYVDDLVRVVARCERPPFVMGHSLGGAVGVGAATEIPLAGLIHLAGIYTFASRNRTLRALCRASLAAEPLLMASPARVCTGWAGDLLGQLYAISDIAGYGFPISGWTPNSIERPLLAERLAKGFDWTSVEVWMQMCRWATGERMEYADAFREVDVPLMVIAGDHDPLVRRADAVACYEDSGSTDRELHLFDAYDNQVHWGHLDLILGRRAPEETWPRIVEWLNARS